MSVLQNVQSGAFQMCSALNSNPQSHCQQREESEVTAASSCSSSCKSAVPDPTCSSVLWVPPNRAQSSAGSPAAVQRMLLCHSNTEPFPGKHKEGHCWSKALLFYITPKRLFVLFEQGSSLSSKTPHLLYARGLGSQTREISF